MKPEEELRKISSYAGGRQDLVQAGGGNSSVKLDDGTMLVKASGISLSDITPNSGFVAVNNREISSYIRSGKIKEGQSRTERDRNASEILKANTIHGGKPSIETFLHSLTKKYTLHTHPIALNFGLCRKDWMELLKKIIANPVLVEYRTPGPELAIALFDQMCLYNDKHGEMPEIMFLQNHGLIATSDTADGVIQLTEKMNTLFADYFKWDNDPYRFATKISNVLDHCFGTYICASLSGNQVIQSALKNDRKIFFSLPFSPDGQIFCGTSAMDLKNPETIEMEIRQFIEKFRHLPRIIVFENYLYTLGSTMKKAKDVEDVLVFSLQVLSQCKENITVLNDDEIQFLENWDAEKYRRELKG